MDVLILVGLVALFTVVAFGSGQPAAPHSPRVIYVLQEPHRAYEARGGGCVLLLAIGLVALLALGLPA